MTASSYNFRMVANVSTLIGNLSVSWVILISVIALLLRWVIRGFYRVYFHPLSRFPGPKFSAFTRIPHLISIWNGGIHKYVHDIHEQYGDVVRITPDELSFIDPNAWRDIHGHGSKEDASSPPPKHWPKYGAPVNGHDSLVTKQDTQEHARTRKIFISAFSDRALIKQAPLFKKYTDKLVQNLKDTAEKNAKVNLVGMYNFMTFDVMADLTFGESLHMLDTSDYDPWVKLVFESFRMITKLGIIYNYYPILAGMVRVVMDRTFAKMRYEEMRYSETRVTKRLEKGRTSEGVDIWDLVLQQEDKGKELLPRGEMDSNAQLFMTAGTETTGTLLSGITYILTQNPEVMQKLATEVRSKFASSDDLTMDAIMGLPYLNACLKEALRVYPPVPTGLPHLTPRAGSTICGHFVPPGVTVCATQYSMYKSARNFKDPLSFIPERWLGDERFALDHRSVVQPFAYGSRDCLGKNMAYHEMRLVLANVVYNFDFELCPESEGWMEKQRVYILWEKSPLMVKLTQART
ncbi:cytochrome P450 46A1 [Phaeosphaeriaceae sp. PMI808]|nr:cytochrome P450 46A1 [Phaeosphaeriaceae sp. PMI808]